MYNVNGMNENEEMKANEKKEMNENNKTDTGIRIVMHDSNQFFPKDDPSVIGNSNNSMLSAVWPSL